VYTEEIQNLGRLYNTKKSVKRMTTESGLSNGLPNNQMRN